jgi:cell wall-associated NlpC family hydrolase
MLLRRFLLPLSVLLVAGCSSAPPRPELAGARQDVVINAIAQIGTPYRYGGTSPKTGFDCSGLVQYTHGAAGIRVPRVTGEQKKSARKLGRSRVQPGDLVFFRIGWGKYHVGIMVDEGRFVHAPSSGKKVQITRLDDPYWRERFSAAATFLN